MEFGGGGVFRSSAAGTETALPWRLGGGDSRSSAAAGLKLPCLAEVGAGFKPPYLAAAAAAVATIDGSGQGRMGIDGVF